MAQNEVNQYNEADETNVDITGTPVAPNQMYPYHVDDAFRKLMGALKRTFRSDLFRLRDSTDQTKLAAFDLSSLTTATTRTFSLPNRSGSVALTTDAGQSSRRNLWVNPDFSLSQENGNTLGTSSGFFPADQIALYFLASTAAMSVQRVQVRTLANSLNQIEFKTTTAKASLGANDFVTLTQPIEGSSFAEAGFGTANAKPYAFRFQITAPAGTYHWHFANSAANRHCSVPFVIAGGEANTAVVKEVVVPADTGGTWLTADGVIGLTAELVLAAGATLTGGTASTWGGTFYLAASANFNTLGSTANVVRLADVGFKKDEAAAGYGAWAAGTDAKYREDRYYGVDVGPFSIGAGVTNSATLALVSYRFSRMCKAPSISNNGLAQFRIVTSASFVPSAMTASLQNPEGAELQFTISGAAVAAGVSASMNSPSALFRNARLT